MAVIPFTEPVNPYIPQLEVVVLRCQTSAMLKS